MAQDRRNLQIVITEAGHGKPLYKGELPPGSSQLDVAVPVGFDTANLDAIRQYIVCMSQGIDMTTPNGAITTAYAGAT